MDLINTPAGTKRRAPAWPVHAVCAVCLLLGAVGAHAASVYRCVNANGQVTFQDVACHTSAFETKLDLPGQPLIDRNAPRHPVTTRALHRHRVRRAGRRRTRAPKPVLSWQCTAADGEVFYRHSRCPSSVRGDGTVRSAYAAKFHSGHSRRRHNAWSRVRVHGVKIPRAEACRRIHSAGAAVRDGHLRDAHVSTYDHLMGRDVCSAV